MSNKILHVLTCYSAFILCFIQTSKARFNWFFFFFFDKCLLMSVKMWNTAWFRKKKEKKKKKRMKYKFHCKEIEFKQITTEVMNEVWLGQKNKFIKVCCESYHVCEATVMRLKNSQSISTSLTADPGRQCDYCIISPTAPLHCYTSYTHSTTEPPDV